MNYDLVNLSRQENTELAKYHAFQNAWSIIDSMDRLKSLLEQLSSHGPKTLLNKLQEVREMRNTFHHIYDRIESSLKINFPLVGVLNWTFKESGNNKFIYVFTLASGSNIEDKYFSQPNPFGREISIPIGMVTLTSIIQEKKNPIPLTFSINISEYILLIDKFIDDLENQLKEFFKNINSPLSTVNQDLLTMITIEVNDA